MHEEERQKHIKRETIYRIYDRFDGITWYLQRMLNKIFSLTEKANDKMMEKADDKTRELADDKMMELPFNFVEKDKEKVFVQSILNTLISNYKSHIHHNK